MSTEISAHVTLTREEIAHVYHGGVISLKIKQGDSQASIEISCSDALPGQGTRIRFKHISLD